ncbi:hypothetical protein HWV62_18214 [Athelia sp. TMB]|nr:hypothetical protein HWV62_18214 [Athelia sp. TMB]
MRGRFSSVSPNPRDPTSYVFTSSKYTEDGELAEYTRRDRPVLPPALLHRHGASARNSAELARVLPGFVHLPSIQRVEPPLPTKPTPPTTPTLPARPAFRPAPVPHQPAPSESGSSSSSSAGSSTLVSSRSSGSPSAPSAGAVTPPPPYQQSLSELIDRGSGSPPARAHKAPRAAQYTAGGGRRGPLVALPAQRDGYFEHKSRLADDAHVDAKNRDADDNAAKNREADDNAASAYLEAKNRDADDSAASAHLEAKNRHADDNAAGTHLSASALAT